MPLPVIDNVYRVALHWQHVGGPYAISVIHVQAPASSESDVRDALNANWTNEMQETMSFHVDQDSMVIIKLDGTSAGLPFDGVGNSAGQDATEAIAQACSLVQLRTLVRGPRGRGRIFLPFLAEGAQNTGLLDNTKRTTQQTAWNTFLDDMITDGMQLVVASYEHEEANTVQNVTMRVVSATQKRRNDRWL